MPWLSRIAHNLAIDAFRRNRRYPEIVLEDGSAVFNSMEFAEDSAEEKQITQDTQTRLRDFIKELPTEQKQVLELLRSLKPPKGRPGKEILELAGTIAPDDLEIMRQVAEGELL